MTRATALTIALLVTLAGAAGCTSSGNAAVAGRPVGSGPVTIRVPANAPTIQGAVNAARPGDLILIEPGVYRESVKIGTANLTLRGTDRNAVVVDGEFLRDTGILSTAAGTAIQNLTVRNNRVDGVRITGAAPDAAPIAAFDAARPLLGGFRVSYVTAYNNGERGIDVVAAATGVVERSYASGHKDAGIQLGQCQPCRIRVEANLVERNAAGVRLRNASQSVTVVGNRFTHNRVGLSIESVGALAFSPQQKATVVGNAIDANADGQTPGAATGAFGLGVSISGGRGNVVSRNLISGHPRAGILTAGVPANANSLSGNKFSGNALDTITNTTGVPVSAATTPPSAPAGVAPSAMAGPPPQPQMPDAARAPTLTRWPTPPGVEVAKVPVPKVASAVPVAEAAG